MSNAFVIIKMCYVHNQWYDILCATLYLYSSSKSVCYSVYRAVRIMTRPWVGRPVDLSSLPNKGNSYVQSMHGDWL